MRGLFVTGTDTGVGKTPMTFAMMRALVGSGLRFEAERILRITDPSMRA